MHTPFLLFQNQTLRENEAYPFQITVYLYFKKKLFFKFIRLYFLFSTSIRHLYVTSFHLPIRARDEPTLVSKLSKKHHVVQIAVGSTYSAAVTATGELYTWGRGNYGRLGHGNSEDHIVPTLVVGLRGHRVVDVACGSGDAQTVAVTDTGKLFCLQGIPPCTFLVLLFI